MNSQNTSSLSIQCPLCNDEVTTNDRGYIYPRILSHLNKKHGINASEAKKQGLIKPEWITWNQEKFDRLPKEKAKAPSEAEKSHAKMLKKFGENYMENCVTCEICGVVSTNLLSHLNRTHKMNLAEYKAKYNNASAISEYYLKNQSERLKGEGNPMYNNHSGENSPYSYEFYLKRGLADNEESAKEMALQKSRETHSNMDKSKYNTNIQYYLAKGMSYVDSVKAIQDRQKTNTVESIAARNNISIDEAQIIRDEITSKWDTTMKDKPIDEIIEINRRKLMNNFSSISNSSLIFFKKLIEAANLHPKLCFYDQREICLIDKINNHKIAFYDFCIGNKIIEYNGDRYHANPNNYKADDIVFYRENPVTASEIWKNDEIKRQMAIDNGYEIISVWERDIKNDIKAVLERCMEFLNKDFTPIFNTDLYNNLLTDLGKHGVALNGGVLKNEFTQYSYIHIGDNFVIDLIHDYNNDNNYNVLKRRMATSKNLKYITYRHGETIYDLQRKILGIF